MSTGKLYYALALLGLTIPQVFFQVYLTVLVAPFFCVGIFFVPDVFMFEAKSLSPCVVLGSNFLTYEE